MGRGTQLNDSEDLMVIQKTLISVIIDKIDNKSFIETKKIKHSLELDGESIFQKNFLFFKIYSLF